MSPVLSLGAKLTKENNIKNNNISISSTNTNLAMKAILISAKSHSLEIKIKSTVIPRLGTWVGQMASEVLALQMFTAYKKVILDEYTYPKSFHESQKEQIKLNRFGKVYE